MSDEIMKPSEITEHFTIPNVRGTSTTNRAGYEAYLQARAQRKSVGRYTLEEAAMAIAEASGARADEMLDKFMNAAGEGALPTYEPGKDSRYIYGEDFASRVREFYEEAYWDDLNGWLDSNEPRIIWRFPRPASENGGTGGTATETAKERRAVAAETSRGVKREILEHWDGIAQDHGPNAGAAQVARYLKKHRDASMKEPERKTIHNRLGELRAAKLIP